jgi:hypothetical protein
MGCTKVPLKMGEPMPKPSYVFRSLHKLLFHWRLFLLGLPMVFAMPFTTACAEGCAGIGHGDAGGPIVDGGTTSIDGGDPGDGDAGTVGADGGGNSDGDAGTATDAGILTDAGAASGLFCIMDAGTVTDAGIRCTYIKSGTPDLEWQGCPAGQSGEDCSIGSVDSKRYADALAYCDDLSWSGYADWRLPKIDELRSLIAGCPQNELEEGNTCPITHECSYSTGGTNTCVAFNCPGCDSNSGPGPDGCYWPADLRGDCNLYFSASLQAEFEAYTLDFYGGNVGGGGFVNRSYTVRCVRSRP